MPSNTNSSATLLEQLLARREPNLQILAESNCLLDPVENIPVKQRRTIITVDASSCRWPIGDPQQEGFYLCGATASHDDSYCARHMTMARAPVMKTRRVA